MRPRARRDHLRICDVNYLHPQYPEFLHQNIYIHLHHTSRLESHKDPLYPPAPTLYPAKSQYDHPTKFTYPNYLYDAKPPFHLIVSLPALISYYQGIEHGRLAKSNKSLRVCMDTSQHNIQGVIRESIADTSTSHATNRCYQIGRAHV